MSAKHDVYVCAVPFIARGGIGVARGTRLRGDNDLVRDHFGYWAPDGTPESEWPRAEIRFEEPQAPAIKRREIPVNRQVRAIRGFTAFVKGRHHVVRAANSATAGTRSSSGSPASSRQSRSRSGSTNEPER